MVAHVQALTRQSDYPGLRFGHASMMGRNGQRVVEGRCKGGIPISDMVRRKDLGGKGGELRAVGNCEKVRE